MYPISEYFQSQTLWLTSLVILIGGLLLTFLTALQFLNAAVRTIEIKHRVTKRTAELTAAQIRLNSILNALGEGVYGVDLSGVATFFNPAAERMLGWKAKEILGKNHWKTQFTTS